MRSARPAASLRRGSGAGADQFRFVDYMVRREYAAPLAFLHESRELCRRHIGDLNRP